MVVQRPAKKDSKVGSKVLSTEELIALLKPGRELEAKAEAWLKDLKGGMVTLWVADLKNYADLNRFLIQYFLKKEMQGVYVTINRPFEDLVKGVQLQGAKGIQFVDMITLSSGGQAVKADNCMYLESPVNLFELNEAVEKGLARVQGEHRFLVVDAVSTLLIYNKPDEVEKLVHTLASKARSMNAFTALLMVENQENKGVLETLSQFVDKVAWF